MKFAVVANPHKYEVKTILSRTVEWAGRNEVDLYITKETCDLTSTSKDSCVTITASDKESISAADYIVVIGGDGTILYTARISTQQNKPILGVNSGRLGFMTNIQMEELETALDHIKAKNYKIDQRHYLKATDKEGHVYYALNEFLFTRRDSASMINISAEYQGSLINTYWADGLIVASSTGSTAYNLASGGPIVVPGTGVMLLTPVNPHTLTTRPLVLRDDTNLTIRVEDQESEISFSYDGVVRNIEKLPFEVDIIKSNMAVNLINLPGHDYFETLRKKLMWGQDSRRTK